MKRRGFTLIELLVVVAIIALLIAILLPSLGKARELSNRAVCAANIRGIGQSMAVYAADNSDSYPVTFAGAGWTAQQSTTPATAATQDAAINIMYTTPYKGITNNMWILCALGQVASKQFLCKSDATTVDAAPLTSGTNYYAGFNTSGAVLNESYSFAYPCTTTGVGGWWKNTTAADLPIIGDMNASGGTGTNTKAMGNATKNANTNTWNHNSEGENIGFGDSHVDWTRRSDVGQGQDNVYTTNAGIPGANGSAVAATAAATAVGGTAGAYDVCLVPVALYPTYVRN